MTAKFINVHLFYSIQEGKEIKLTPREFQGSDDLEGFVGEDMETLLNCAEFQIRNRLLNDEK